MKQHCSVSSHALGLVLLVIAHLFFSVECRSASIVQKYRCTRNVTVYGFNLWNPRVVREFPILPISSFLNLCSEYKRVMTCWLDVEDEEDDMQILIVTRNIIAFTKSLDYACYEGYDTSIPCLQNVKPKLNELFEDSRYRIRLAASSPLHEFENPIQKHEVIEDMADDLCRALRKSLQSVWDIIKEPCGYDVALWYHESLLRLVKPSFHQHGCDIETSDKLLFIYAAVIVCFTAIFLTYIYIVYKRYQWIAIKKQKVFDYFVSAPGALRQLQFKKFSIDVTRMSLAAAVRRRSLTKRDAAKNRNSIASVGSATHDRVPNVASSASIETQHSSVSRSRQVGFLSATKSGFDRVRNRASSRLHKGKLKSPDVIFADDGSSSTSLRSTIASVASMRTTERVSGVPDTGGTSRTASRLSPLSPGLERTSRSEEDRPGELSVQVHRLGSGSSSSGSLRRTGLPPVAE